MKTCGEKVDLSNIYLQFQGCQRFSLSLMACPQTVYSRSHPKMSKAGSDRQLQMETQSFYQSAGEQSHV